MADTTEITTRISQFIAEKYPTVDLAPGSALRELVVKLSASIQNEIYNDITTLSQGGSFKAAQESTTDTYSDVIANIASNYLVTRNAGTTAQGVLKVLVSSNTTKYVTTNTQFKHTATGLIYTTSKAYTASTNPEAEQLRIYTQSTGLYYYLLPVSAVAPGADYQVAANSTFTPVISGTVSGLVSISAFGAFTSGKDVETDKQLISRIATGMTNKGMTSEASILAKLSSVYPDIRDIAIIGANDAELLRSKQNAFGLNTFGMADVYIRSCNGVNNTTIQVAGTKQSAGVWTFSLDYTHIAGFYDILYVRPEVGSYTGTIDVTQKTFGATTIPREVNNVINNATEARYTQYQTCNVTLNYVEVPLVANGSTQTFSVTVTNQPYIRECQQIINSRSERIPGADYLIRSAIPCFVSLKLQVEKSGTASVPVSSIQQDIFSYINTLKFGDPIYASRIVDICHNYPEVRRVVTPVVLTGLLAAPDGTTRTITSSDVLATDAVIPNISSKMVGFFTSYGAESSGIAVEVI